MQRLFKFLANKHADVYKVLIFILSIAVIVFFFPRQAKFKYDLNNSKGKPWNHEDLVAPFDFAIMKSNKQIEQEKAQLAKNARSFFMLDTTVVIKQKKIFEENINTQWSQSKSDKLKSRFLALGNELLDSVYKKGVIQLNDKFENAAPDFSISVLSGTEAEEHDISEFLTIQSADDYLRNFLQKKQVSDIPFLTQLIENSLTYNLFYDKATTDKVLKQEQDNITVAFGGYVKNQSVVLRGEIVDAQKFQVLQSLKHEYEKQSGGTVNYVSILAGQIIVVSLCLIVLAIFLLMLRKDIFIDNAKITFILLLIVLMVVSATIAMNAQQFNLYLLPLCILPVIIRAFFDTRLALFAHIVTVLLIAFIAPNRYEYTFVQIVGGMVAIFSVLSLRNRSQFFTTAILVFVAYALAYIGINVVQEGTFNTLSWHVISWFGISALLTLFAYPLIFVFEKVFGFLSDVSLMELSDTNSPLLRELALKAPGTFQHSLQVANLAEEVVYQIGGDPLLVRTGALYHDIGKMQAPIYFIENQSGGVNPHDELSYEESAAVIISHVTNGIELAKKYNLPQQIIDFIRTHHGTNSTLYFLKMYKKEHPNEEIDEQQFHYPGPIPFSRETAVLMVSDSVEAASRSLKTYSEQTIHELVENIINNLINLNQFANADITFRDINVIKKILKKKLISMYHVRVEYPR